MDFPNNNDFNNDATFVNMEVASGTYQFKFKYSKTEDISDDNTITFPIFKVHGHEFKILYTPPGSEGFVGLTLEMCKTSEKVTVYSTIVLLDKYGQLSPEAFKTICISTFCPDSRDRCDFPHTIKQSELEVHFVRDGCFTIVCRVTILSECYKEVPKRFVNGVMPFSIDEHLFELLDRKETVDVNFEVDGEIFPAHRLILAARSSVFKMKFFGPKTETKTETIIINDIKPAVFKAMLSFIYTDSLPDFCGENFEWVTMIGNLLVAADRYELGGLQILCENSLLRGMSVDTALSILRLAEQLELYDLKDACLCLLCELKNFALLASTSEYVKLMVDYPTLLEVINCRIKDNL